MNLFIEKHQDLLKELLLNKVDFLTRISMIEFEDADKRKIIADIDDIKIPFLHLNDLVLSKFNTGRLKDKADVEELQKIHSGKGGNL